MTVCGPADGKTWSRATLTILLVIAVLGILARLALSSISVGSFDARLWTEFARAISDEGLLTLYSARADFNHPPIPGYLAMCAWKLSESIPQLSFAVIFKLPMIAADAIVCVLLYRIWSKRRSASFAALIAAAFAWNLDAILISAHHCNTDPIYAMLALLAVYLIEDRRAHLLGGLALGAAINVKLIPIVLLIPLIAGYREWRELAKFAGGLLIAAIPFIPLLIARGPEFVRNAMGYTSSYAYWGVNAFLLPMVRDPRFSGWAQPLAQGYHDLGRFILILMIALAALVARRRGGLDRYVTSATAAAIFLILTPGFGVQYTVFVGPLLFACQPATGALYASLAGLGLLFLYWLGWTGGLPIDTWTAPENVAPSPQFGLLAWATLIVFVWGVYFRRPGSCGERRNDVMT